MNYSFQVETYGIEITSSGTFHKWNHVSQSLNFPRQMKKPIRKVWCEDCSKYISVTTRHFQNEIHLQNNQRSQQNTQSAFGIQSTFGNITNFGKGVGIIMNERTYNKLKINPTENLEEQNNNLIRNNFFPRYKFQLSCLAKFSKIVNGEEEVFKRWVKSDLNYNHRQQDVQNTLMQKLDDEQLEGSGFVF